MSDKPSIPRLTFKRQGHSCIAFPPGLPLEGGTCEFATEACLRFCYAKKYNQRKDWSWQQKVFECFMMELKSTHGREWDFYDKMAEKIYYEMMEDGTTRLFWFAAGDCISSMTNWIRWIMIGLNGRRFHAIQHGFTRNKNLWNNIRLDAPEIRLFLTIEKENDILSKGFYAIPEYNNTDTKLYYNSDDKLHDIGSCGVSLMIERENWKKPSKRSVCYIKAAITSPDSLVNSFLGKTVIHNLGHCDRCWKKQIGCFFNWGRERSHEHTRADYNLLLRAGPSTFKVHKW